MGDTFVDPGLVPEPEAVEELAPEEPAWGGPSQEEWGSIVGYIQAQQQAAYEAQQAEQGPGFDLYDDDAPGQIQALIRQEIANAMSPVSEWYQAQQEAEGQERLRDVIADDVSRNGEFLLGAKAEPIVLQAAREAYPEFARRFGDGDRAAAAAIEKAAKDWREAEKALADAAIQRHMNQLTNLAGAGHEPPATGIGAQQVVSTPGGDELSLVRKYGGIPT